MTEDLRPAHRRALEGATAFVDGLSPDALARPTPCAGWDLAALLAHMVGQHHGFAAAVADGDAPADAYAPAPFTPEAWARSVDALVEALAAADLDVAVLQIELAPSPLPVSVLVGAQLLDTVVHTWDVARARELAYTPSEAEVAALAAMLPVIPDDDGRRAAGAAFGPARPSSGDGWPAVLTWLGCDPAWTPG